MKVTFEPLDDAKTAQALAALRPSLTTVAVPRCRYPGCGRLAVRELRLPSLLLHLCRVHGLPAKS